jgi:glutathione S-transferase
MSATTTELFSLSNPVFSHYAFYGAVVISKMLAMAFLTAVKRFAKGAFANPEDLKLGSKKGVVLNDPDVERVRRNHLNDLENIPAFLFLGFLYVATQPSVAAALWHFRIFAISRFLHTVAYQVPLPQPSRALTFFAGVGVCISMAYQIIKATY